MATVFMKWLETSPKDYERGIRLLTLGRLQTIQRKIADTYIQPGLRVLEIGCGTGALTAMMAARGAAVTAIDASPAMLAEAEKKISGQDFGDRVSLKFMDAALIGERFAPASFDLIVSTLAFSEFPAGERRFVLEACAGLLKPGGRLLIADEVIPGKVLARLFYYLVRLPLVLLTWLLTRTSTTALQGFEELLGQAGFFSQQSFSYLGNSLVLYEARRIAAGIPGPQAELTSRYPPAKRPPQNIHLG